MIPMLIAVIGSLTVALTGVLVLVLIAKLTATVPGRPNAWQRCFKILVALGMAALSGAIVAPSFLKTRTTRHPYGPCVVNLKLIEGAKAIWACEMKKTLGDAPLDVDLFGPAQLIRERPTCPEGGVYRIGAVGEKPQCSVSGHEHSLD